MDEAIERRNNTTADIRATIAAGTDRRPRRPRTRIPGDHMYLSADDIARLDGIRKVHFLNPDAIRNDKSLGDATGLRRLGAHLITVAPGHDSTEIHAHHLEEECLYVISGFGSATLGERTVRIGPGDFIGFPTNGIAHGLTNTGDEPLVCLVVGQRLDVDIVDYPRHGKRLYRHDGDWDVADVAALSHPERGNHPFDVPVAMAVREKLRMIEIDESGKPVGYPAHLSDPARGACMAAAALYRSVGYRPPWICYLCIVDDKCIGSCAFKSAPRGHEIEIAYFTFPEFEGRGYATTMARALIEMAREHDPEMVVLAMTLPEETPSTKVLRKLGFRLVGRVRHPEDDEGEAWEWDLPAPV
jgi:uncharacterized cupin superfamily protein/GNAT superfamily N-acetyltransferase